jgi:hypothetical protein
MNPYSHLVVAAKLEHLVQPEDPQEYYWGAIAPDIRYVAALKRQQTHLPSGRILEWISQYPQLKSFLQGYLVHCLSDEIDLGQIFLQHFPFSILQRKMYRKQVAIILELFYLEHEKINVHISGVHNAVLTELGLSESLSTRFSQMINQYMSSPSHEARLLAMSQLLGLKSRRINKYMTVAKTFQRNWVLRCFLFLALRTGRISEEIISKVTSLLSRCNIVSMGNRFNSFEGEKTYDS